MNLTRKTSPPSRADVTGDLPTEFPALPQEVRDRFPALADYEDRVKRWWFDTQTVLARRQQSLEDRIAKLEA